MWWALPLVLVLASACASEPDGYLEPCREAGDCPEGFGCFVMPLGPYDYGEQRCTQECSGKRDCPNPDDYCGVHASDCMGGGGADEDLELCVRNLCE